MTQRVLSLIDDQADVRQALADMLSVFGYEVATFASADDFLADPSSGGAACVISDVRMPGMDGISLVRHVAALPFPPHVILISGHADVPMAVEALKAGAFDFIEKPVDDVKLVASINRALASRLELADAQRLSQDLSQRLETLTPRELEVFDLVASGLTSQIIGEKLGISVRTVESYRAQIMDKMQADGVAALVRQAIRLGRIDA
jgi:two-component system, LuxR family, response regulator FixJ